jgi:hypothetical protein
VDSLFRIEYASAMKILTALFVITLFCVSSVHAQDNESVTAIVLVRPGSDAAAVLTSRTVDTNACLAYGRTIVSGLQTAANVACLDRGNQLLVRQRCIYTVAGTPACETLPMVNLDCRDPKTSQIMGCLPSAAPTTPGYTNGVPNSIMNAGKPASMSP